MPRTPRNRNHRDVHLYVPNAIAEEIEALVGPGQRNAFLIEAAVEKLARLRRQDRRRAAAAAARIGQASAGEDGDDNTPESPTDPDRQRFDALWGR